MKKLILSVFALSFALSVYATGGDEKGNKNPENTTPHTVTQATPPKTAASPDFPGSLVFDLGFNFLTDAPEDMDLSFFGSKIFNIYYMYEIQLGSSAFTFNPGFGVGLEKYKFDNDVTLAMTDEGTVLTATPDEWNIKKSKLAANYFDVPLELTFHANKENFRKSFKVGVGVKGGILFDSHTKIRYKENGDAKILKSKEDFDLSRFRYGALGRIGIGGFSLFYYQELSELFKDGKGPEGTGTSPFKVGLSFNIF